MKVLVDNILVLPKEESKKTKSGILLPDDKTESTITGEVISTGPGNYIPYTAEFKKMAIEKGMIIAFNKHAGQRITINGEEHRIIKESDVLIVL